MINVEAWLQSGKYLPKCLRDFHDQKAVFKTMHTRIKEDPTALIKRPDWVAGQVYVIDTFLWFMARRGYTLQKVRAKGDFRDLDADVAKFNKEQSESFTNILNSIQS